MTFNRHTTEKVLTESNKTDMENSQQPLRKKIEELVSLEIESLNSKKNLKESYNEYSKFLDWTIEKQIDEYKMFSLTIYDSQMSTVKNYLWLSAMLIGADCSLLTYMNFSLLSLTALDATVGASTIFSAALSLETFIKGTRLLMTSNGGKVPNVTDSYLENLQEAYGSDASHSIFAVKNRMASQLQHSINYLRSVVSEKALKIRSLNSNLVISASVTSIAALLYYLFK